MSRTGNRGRGLRPLGSMRKITVNANKTVNIPKLTSFSETDVDNKIDEKYEGIHGSALSVPPPQEVPEEVEKSKKTNPVRTCSGKSQNSGEKIQKVTDTQVRDLELRIANLEKIIRELRALLVQRDQDVESLQEKLRIQVVESKSALDRERSQHSETRKVLEETQSDLQGAQRQIDTLRCEFAAQLAAQKQELEKIHSEAISEKDRELAERELRLDKLKNQMADALKGNSWERQHQLEELTKELTRIQDEADLLRMKLKAFSKQKSANCANCPALTSKLEQALTAVTSRDSALKDQKLLITKLKKQLGQDM